MHVGVRAASSISRRDSPAERSGGLDAVRAIACLMVLLCHLSLYHGDGALLPLKNGVLLFFALSGYLLYRPFVVGAVDLRRYALLRVARVMPAYLIVLLGVTALTGDRTFLDRPATYMLFLQDLDPALWQRFVGVTWTLAIEAAFYVTLPLIAWLVARSAARLVGLGVASFFGALGAYLLFGPVPAPLGWWVSSIYPLTFWAFLPGMLVALTEGRVRLGHRALAVGVVLLASSFVTDVWTSVDLISGVGAGILVAWTVSARPSLGPFRPVAMAGAALSYAVYLWHVDILKQVPDSMTALVAIAGIGTATYLLVERPALVWARRATARWTEARPIAELSPIAATVTIQPGDLVSSAAVPVELGR